MIIAYVPARGGSKEILRKNLIEVGGVSLLERTVRAAEQSHLIDQIWVSSEDSEINEVALDLGAEPGYHRPFELASDESTIGDGLLDFLEWFEVTQCSIPSVAVVLQPTSPFRDGLLIDNAIQQFLSISAASMFSVSDVNEHPREMIVWHEEGSDWRSLLGLREAAQRQAYDQNIFYINGSMYLVRPEFVREEKELVVPGRSIPFVIPKDFGFEIDSSFDLLQIRRLMNGRP